MARAGRRALIGVAAAHGPRYVDPYRRRGRLYLAVCRFSTTPLGMWLSEKVAWKLDPHLLQLTRGRFGSTGPVASALLETRGARTGRTRRNATLYFHDGDTITIVASKRGEPFTAHVVEDEAQRARLWSLADRVFPQFADYRQWAARSGRVIPIVQLGPRR